MYLTVEAGLFATNDQSIDPSIIITIMDRCDTTGQRHRRYVNYWKGMVEGPRNSASYKLRQGIEVDCVSVVLIWQYQFGIHVLHLSEGDDIADVLHGSPGHRRLARGELNIDRNACIALPLVNRDAPESDAPDER